MMVALSGPFSFFYLSPTMPKRNNKSTDNENGNQGNGAFLRTFVAESMWLVSVETVDLVAAAKNRREILQLLIIIRDTVLYDTFF